MSVHAVQVVDLLQASRNTWLKGQCCTFLKPLKLCYRDLADAGIKEKHTESQQVKTSASYSLPVVRL